MSGFREWLARLISPELGTAADLDAAKVRYMKSLADELASWCWGHVPIAAECGEWMLAKTRIHFRPNAEFMADAERGKFTFAEDIGGLREKLKKMQVANPIAPKTEDETDAEH